jgi:hypothetical protein
MNTDQENEFIESLDGEISPEQLDQLLGLGQGDTGALSSEQAAQPEAAQAHGGKEAESADSEDAGAGKQQGQEPELNADNAVVLTRDGKHTIPFDRLTEAREQARSERALREAAEERAAAAQRELESLRVQAQARAEAGEAPTKTDNQLAAAQAAIDQGVDPGIFGDFSEEALAKGIATLVASQVEARVSKALEPIQAKQASELTNQHYAAIYEAHPDADSIVESRELADWINSQPSYARDAYAAVLQQGSTGQVIELFDAFKQATGVTQPGASAAADVKTKAQQAAAQATAPVPNSLTDIAGGRSAGVGRDEALAHMEGFELLQNMDSMSREQMEAWLNNL